MTEPKIENGFLTWYSEGKPIPVMHPIPWVYAEVEFPSPRKIEWRIYNFKEETYTIETFKHESAESGGL